MNLTKPVFLSFVVVSTNRVVGEYKRYEKIASDFYDSPQSLEIQREDIICKPVINKTVFRKRCSCKLLRSEGEKRNQETSKLIKILN